MLAVCGGQLVMLSTPFGRRGAFYEAWEHGGSAYERYRVPASEVRVSAAEFLAEEKAALGEWFYQSEYECDFGDAPSGSLQLRRDRSLFQ